MTCTGSYAVTQVDIDAGSVYNLATADSTESEPDDDDATVTLPQNPALALIKTGTFDAGADSFANPGELISYEFLVSNEGNVTLTGITVTDPIVSPITCPASTLAVGVSMTCMASYAVTQTDIDAGFVYNLATADSTESAPDDDDATVTLPQNPAITLTKTAAESTYAAVGDIIHYTLVAKNTGNVTLHDVSITDPLLPVLTCTPAQPAVLALNATLTCTGAYTIQAADLAQGMSNKVTNTAVVNGKGPQDQPVSAEATANVYQQTGALLPTQTTCQMYAGGPGMWPAMYSAFTYQVKANKISSVSPGVIFYYNTITAPSASFTLAVTQTNSLNWKPMLIQDLGQAVLFTADCNKAPGVTVTTSSNPYTVTFTVTGATPEAIYYIGIKYSPQNLIGQQVIKDAASIYTFNTTGYLGSTASIAVKPKK
jgi:uncharacterized repeat protein (TIGR01451 family)